MFVTLVEFSHVVQMDAESETIIPINELDESAGSKESIPSDENDSCLENVMSVKNDDIGRISLEFVDGNSAKFDDYPRSYYTFSAKERLLLIFAENFRCQFINTYPDRNRLVLAIPNECGIQKFVSTTVRPTSFLFHEFIDCWNGPAHFVADFIKFEPLEDQLQLVSENRSQLKKVHHICFFLFGKILLNSLYLYIYNMIF